MKKIVLGLSALCLLIACGSSEQPAVIKVSEETLMHEVRATPSPADGTYVKVNPPRFMWPDKFPHLGPVLDGVPGQVDEKPKVVYWIRISQDKNFKNKQHSFPVPGIREMVLATCLCYPRRYRRMVAGLPILYR